jgi:hypothetical protein
VVQVHKKKNDFQSQNESKKRMEKGEEAEKEE